MTQTKTRFRKPDLVTDVKMLTESATDERGILALAHRYDEYTKHYYNRSTKLLSPYMPLARREQRKRLLLKLVEQATTANTTPELFMKAQFEQLAMFLPDVFPAIEIVVSDKAPKRWASYMRRMRESYVTPTEREKRITEVIIEPDAQWYLERSVINICERLHRTLVILGSLNDVVYGTMLETMTRGGNIKGEYLVTLDERWAKCCEYVANVVSETKNKYRPEAIQKLVTLRRQFVDKYAKDERVKQYA